MTPERTLPPRGRKPADVLKPKRSRPATQQMERFHEAARKLRCAEDRDVFEWALNELVAAPASHDPAQKGLQ